MLNVSAGPSVFIVHRDDGNVFIVENKESEPLIDQILKAPKVDEHLDFISIK